MALAFQQNFLCGLGKKNYRRSCLIAIKSAQTLLRRKRKAARSQRLHRRGLKNLNHLSAHSQVVFMVSKNKIQLPLMPASLVESLEVLATDRVCFSTAGTYSASPCPPPIALPSATVRLWQRMNAFLPCLLAKTQLLCIVSSTSPFLELCQHLLFKSLDK